MSKFHQGPYTVKNPEKYVGKGKPRFRSSWELTFMMFLDNNDQILQWASESIAIPYRHPLTGKMTQYIPDFLITYRTKDNQMRAELIEIKPKKQSILEAKMKDRDRAIVAINYCKWDAAQKWCKRQGISFRVINEDQIYHQGRNAALSGSKKR